MNYINYMLKFVIGLVGLFIILLGVLLGNVIFESTYSYPAKIIYGVTFAPKYASFLKLDWKKVYIQMLDDGILNLRLPGYWDVLEKDKDKYDFSETDFLFNEAEKRKAKVILSLGEKQPRWPECQIPNWAKGLKLEDRRQRILEFISKVVERYKNSSSLVAWQVENEPFLPFFGENCDSVDKKSLKAEVDLVRSLSNKKVIVSDSGELGSWIVPMQLSDIFGTTLYRDVYNPVMGYFSYPLLPYLYNLKSQLVRMLAPANQKTVIIELQSEPWLSNGDSVQNVDEQLKRFPLKKMKSYIDYAKKTGFDEMYLWGVEWWYLMEKEGHPEYLNYAKTLFR